MRSDSEARTGGTTWHDAANRRAPLESRFLQVPLCHSHPHASSAAFPSVVDLLQSVVVLITHALSGAAENNPSHPGSQWPAVSMSHA